MMKIEEKKIMINVIKKIIKIKRELKIKKRKRKR